MKRFFSAIYHVLLTWGPWGALCLSIFDSAGIPLPEGTDLLLIALACQSARIGYLSAGMAVIGSLIGSVFLYYLGRKGGQVYLDERTQAGWPKRFRRWFHHYGALAVFIPVAIPAPLPMKVFVLSAGALRMNRVHFMIIVLIARSLRYFGLAFLGAQLGQYPLQYLNTHKLQLGLISVGIFAVLYAAIKIKDMLRQRAHPHHLPASSDETTNDVA